MLNTALIHLTIGPYTVSFFLKGSVCTMSRSSSPAADDHDTRPLIPLDDFNPGPLSVSKADDGEQYGVPKPIEIISLLDVCAVIVSLIALVSRLIYQIMIVLMDCRRSHWLLSTKRPLRYTWAPNTSFLFLVCCCLSKAIAPQDKFCNVLNVAFYTNVRLRCKMLFRSHRTLSR